MVPVRLRELQILQPWDKYCGRRVRVLMGGEHLILLILVPVLPLRLFGEEMGHGRHQVGVAQMLFLMEQLIPIRLLARSLRVISSSEMQRQNGHVSQKDQQDWFSELILHERVLSGEKLLVCTLQDEN